jgi:hypothetical protein
VHQKCFNYALTNLLFILCKSIWIIEEDYNFSLDLIAIGGLNVKVWDPKVAGVPPVRISGLSFGSPRTKCHLDVAPVERCREWYKGGKVVASPKSRPWWVFWVWSCRWFVLTRKMLKLCTNQHVVWFVQIQVSYLSFFLVPSWSSSTPLYPQSVVSQVMCPNSLLFRCFHFKLTFESIKEVGSASNVVFYISLRAIKI